jgi:hypothetical protein
MLYVFLFKNLLSIKQPNLGLQSYLYLPNN